MRRIPIKSASKLVVAGVAIGSTAVTATGVGIAIHRRRKRRGVHAIKESTARRALVMNDRCEDGTPIRVLSVDGSYQSATYLSEERRFEPVFEYYKAFDHMFEADLDIFDVLMLGGGGYSYPKQLISTHPEVNLDVVESDIAITEAAKEFFFLDELIEKYADGDRLGLITADARGYLDCCTKTYDVIINDCFEGEQPTASLKSVEAVQSAHDLLNEDGLYMVNVVSRDEGADLSDLRDTTATLLQVFENVYIISCTDEQFGGEDNYLVIASDCEQKFEEEIPFDEGFLGNVLWDKE